MRETDDEHFSTARNSTYGWFWHVFNDSPVECQFQSYSSSSSCCTEPDNLAAPSHRECNGRPLCLSALVFSSTATQFATVECSECASPAIVAPNLTVSYNWTYRGRAYKDVADCGNAWAVSSLCGGSDLSQTVATVVKCARSRMCTLLMT